MKLSMSLIAQELSGSVNHIHLYHADNDSPKISRMKIFLENTALLDEEYVYLCQPAQLLQLLENKINLSGQNFIVYGNEPSFLESESPDCCCLFLSTESGLFPVINAVESIFTSYNEWESTLLNMVVSQNTLQDMLDFAYKKIKIPMCLLDTNYNVIAINHQAETSDELYCSMQKGYGYPYIDIIRTSNPTHPELDKAAVCEVINKISHNRLRVTAIRSHGQSCFYLGLHKQDSMQFASCTLELYEHFIQILVERISLFPTDTVIHCSLFEQFITDLISGKEIEAELIEQILTYFNYKQNDNYHMLIVQFVTPLARSSLKLPEIMNMVESYVPDSKCFYLQPYVGILTRTCSMDTYWQRLKNVLRPYQTRCAESPRFSSILDAGKIWKQLTFILEHDHTGDTLQNYDHYIIRHCTEIVRSRLPHETLYHPYFLRLQKYDTENRTEYLSTLICYLQNNCSTSAAANALYIHRNSMQYRIKKIEDLLGIQIAASEERLNMLFSSFLISESL